ncbi:MAG: tRNA (adenosine(37)-N6)-threonylcarbamoyltransferase complex dimerization subunit type 1 TsaB [Ilyomonas sp.]
MALLLCIDTATEYAGVCLSNNNEILTFKESSDQKNHASFVQPAIKELVNNSTPLKDIDAIAVVNGPGSYTGLRVGLATAKGLCYALNKPLLLLNTLEVIARGAMRNFKEENFLFCPMIDARRMEVFTALYDSYLNAIMEPKAMILDESSFEELLKKNKIVFSGSGHNKLENIINNNNAVFTKHHHNVEDVASAASLAYEKKAFSNVAYSEPFYLKEFFTISHNT